LTADDVVGDRAAEIAEVVDHDVSRDVTLRRARRQRRASTHT
jgi:hypothetical protein